MRHLAWERHEIRDGRNVTHIFRSKSVQGLIIKTLASSLSAALKPGSRWLALRQWDTTAPENVFHCENTETFNENIIVIEKHFVMPGPEPSQNQRSSLEVINRAPMLGEKQYLFRFSPSVGARFLTFARPLRKYAGLGAGEGRGGGATFGR